jgi:hypothetical protein
MKRYLVAMFVMVCCVLAVIGGRLYYTHRYLPIRAVQPIMRLLDEGTRDSVNRGAMLVSGLKVVKYQDGGEGMERDPDRIKITDAGALEVKRALLRVMEKATDPVTLYCLLICVGRSAEESTLDFQGEKEWAIIGAAAERHNADPTRPHRFFVTKDTNGVTVLGMGRAGAIP